MSLKRGKKEKKKIITGYHTRTPQEGVIAVFISVAPEQKASIMYLEKKKKMMKK